MALLADSILAIIVSQCVWMQNPGRPRIVDRAKELLWVIARCDVEGIQAHRTTALQRLRDLELKAAEMRIPDLYREVVKAE
jgi:hypothetical protein